MRIYLDNAATSIIHPEVADYMHSIMISEIGNPSAIHADGRKARTRIEDARKMVASLIHAEPGEIFFTSGGTEADNMAIRKGVDDCGVKHIITSRIEHHAILHTIQELEAIGKIKAHYIPVQSNGYLDTEILEKWLPEMPNAMVSLMHANNEIGNMIDIAQVGEICRKHNALFHCDTVQTMGHFDFNVKQLSVDFLVGAAHKFNGPKGVGFIYINHKNRVHPLITGGSQERNMRGGTENLYGICGLAKALELSYLHLSSDKAHITDLKHYMMQQLKNQLPGVTYNGDPTGNSLYTVLNVRMPYSEKAEMLLFNLDIQGISCSGGSACSSGSEKGSHVMAELGMEENRANVRFSFGAHNTRAEIDQVVQILKQVL